MNVILKFSDHYLLDSLYPQWAERENVLRQTLSIFTISVVGFVILYFLVASLSYLILFDKNIMKSKLFLRNQIRREITLSVKSLPLIAVLTTPWFLGEVRGYSRLYRFTEVEISLSELMMSVIGFIVFTDTAIYWIHRWLHHPLVYGIVHKPHHQWIVTTPFASHAFHPVDGFLQSVPYHIYVYLFPMEEHLYFFLLIMVNIWSISIHDGNHKMKNKVVNSAACHTLHHREFNYNYGQYFTIWDRLGGTYRSPDKYC